MEAYTLIYDCTGYKFVNIQRILRRFNNWFFKGFAKNETEKIKRSKDTKERKK